MKKRAIFTALMLAVSTVAGPVCAVEADSMFTQDAGYEQAVRETSVQTMGVADEASAADISLQEMQTANTALGEEIPAAEEVFQEPELPQGQEPGSAETENSEESEQPAETVDQEPTGEEGSEELGSLEDLSTVGNDTDGLSKSEKAEETDAFQDALEADGEELEASIVKDGTCGGNLTWSLDSLGTLRIQGVGAMTNYGTASNYYTPWNSENRSISTIIVEEGVTTIGNSAFSYCAQTSVSLPSTLEIIGEGAFTSCENMKSITIPSGVISIGKKAFYWCTGLTSVTIPSDIDLLSVGSEIFSECESLVSIILPAGIKKVPSGAFLSCSKLTSVTLESGITSIGSSAFEGTNLSSLVIPSSVESIGNCAFWKCKNLTGVTLQKGLKSLGSWAFYDCTELRSIAIPEGITELNGNTFHNCTSLKAVSLPSTLTSLRGPDYTIGGTSGVFSGCASLEEITLPAGLTQLGYELFRGCTSLTKIVIPDQVTSISSGAFQGCTSLREVTLPQGIKTIGSDAFYGCISLNGISLPDGLTEVGGGAFKGCISLTSITFPPSFTRFNSGSFSNCTSLRSIYFEGDGPNFNWSYIFENVVAKVYYPAGNTTWTNKIGKDYSGTLVWVAYTPILRVPVMTSAANVSGGVQVKWGAVSTATGYYVYRRAGTGSWTLLGRTTGTTYTDKKGTPGTTYSYTVRAYRGDYAAAYANRYQEAYWSSFDPKGVGVRYLSAPVVSSATNTASGIALKWSRTAGASGYYIYRRSAGGSYTKIATIKSGTTVSYGDTKVANGGVYQYAVRAYYGTSVSPYQAKTIARLSRNAISSALNNAAGRITVKWSRNTGATGYQVYYKTGSTSKIVTVKGNAVLTKAITGLAKGSTYTVSVRSYRTVSGVNYYSAWSPTKTVKITK